MQVSALKSEFIFSVLLVFVLALFHEYFLAVRSRAEAYEPSLQEEHQVLRLRAKSALFHGLCSFYSLSLMVIFMYMNGFLNLAIVFGAVLGYFVWSRRSIQC